MSSLPPETGAAGITPAASAERRAPCMDRRIADRRRARLPEAATAWRSGAEVVGYALWASDGLVGRITDLCCEQESLSVTGFIVLARRLFLGERLFVPLGAVARVDAERCRVHVRLTRAELRQLAGGPDSES